jgi:hypothetical protein
MKSTLRTRAPVLILFTNPKGHSSERTKPDSQIAKQSVVINGSDILSPTTSDPGDQTQRNFRYQHGYGVILLVAGATGSRPYRSIWCEHHEDFLCERTDGRFDGVQVKTSRPELGSWTIKDEELRRSICRFARLVGDYPRDMHEVHFVSNTDCLTIGPDVTDITRIARSPLRLLAAVEQCQAESELDEPFATVVTELATACDQPESLIFQTLKKLRITKGPPRDAFDAEIAHNHIPHLPGCASLPKRELDRLLNRMIQLVFNASSLQSDSPERHLCPVNATDRQSPFLLAKRLDVKVATEIGRTTVPFRHYTFESGVNLGTISEDATRRLKKLRRGGIEQYAELMENRARGAEAYLMGLSHERPDDFDELLNQLEGAVYSECQEAHISASQAAPTFGHIMLRDVHDRLRVLAHNHSAVIYDQPYEVLVGLSAILTGSCRIWWSDAFDVANAA